MRHITLTLLLAAGAALACPAQTFRFDLTGNKTAREGHIPVAQNTIYTDSTGYGYDFIPGWDGRGDRPYFFSVAVPDGNYRVRVTLGSKKSAGSTTVRAEARRMMLENAATRKGELREETFIVSKRDDRIDDKERVKLKAREKGCIKWDDKLTLEFNGSAPRVSYIEIEPAPEVPTVFLCGNSTVVDNQAEPYTGWGQMLPQFFNDSVAVANYAESGLTASVFLSQGRLKKALAQMKPGDYVVVEFGHNDQKQKGPGCGAYYNYAYSLKQFIDNARRKGATPILVTPTRRRDFDSQGKVRDTHGDYPAAMREIAAREGVVLVDFQELTKTLIESMSEEESKKLFVHCPAGTYEGQDADIADNTHFSNFGAREIAKIFADAVLKSGLPLARHIKEGFRGFDPAAPDDPAA
ncbi:MAG: rhamnogalacturonan acetylesterase, partial [Muribaculaceae bacterium]|nr:rhamnogalacturonan acetylesterase [Muribaculaceae bacterium]